MATFYRHLNVTSNLDLINLDQFKLGKDPKKGAIIFELYNGDKWVPLTKQTSKFLAPKALRDRFGGVSAMKNILGVNEKSLGLEGSFKTTTKLKSKLPMDVGMESILLEKLSHFAKNINIKT